MDKRITISDQSKPEKPKYYVTCPIDGHRLCKGKPGSEVSIICPKCESLINITVTEELRISTYIEKLGNKVPSENA